MKIFLNLMIALFLMSACHSAPQKEKPADTNISDTIHSNMAQTISDSGLTYLIQHPSIKTENPPLFILMHGFGSNEQDLWELRDLFPKNYIVVSLRAPITLQDGAYEWYSNQQTNDGAVPDSAQLEHSKNLVLQFIQQLRQTTVFDTAKIFLGGFSQGANMSYFIGLTHPQQIRGIAIFSGKLLPSVYSETKKSKSFAPLQAFVGHGDADDRIAYADAVHSVKYVRSKNGAVDFHTYPGMRHQISEQELRDFQKWLSNE